MSKGKVVGGKFEHSFENRIAELQANQKEEKL
jgi:hypothetical protein